MDTESLRGLSFLRPHKLDIGLLSAFSPQMRGDGVLKYVAYVVNAKRVVEFQ